MDFNKFVEAFADLVADKVAARLSQDVTWPDIETKEVPIVVEEPVKEVKEPVKVSIKSQDSDARRVELSKIDVRTLRKQMRLAGGEYEGIDTQKKSDVVEAIIAYEKLLGRTIEEEIAIVPDDNDLSEPEAEDDDEPVELTREAALELSLPKLREIAAENGHDSKSWAGLDVDAVVALIFDGVSPQEEPVSEPETKVDEDDEDGYTKEEIEKMSLSELRELVRDAIDQGVQLNYHRTMGRDELIEEVLKVI